MNHDGDLQKVVQYFESLSLDTVDRIGDIYTDDAFFKDPFNEVRGLAAITHVFRHMFTQVDAPRFIVTRSVCQGSDAFITWDFVFRMKRYSSTEQCIRGASHLRFADNGRIASHRDYWDAAEELYEKLPVLGGLMRILKRAARS
jgi:ketosteroid isomerase-like protein